MLTFADCRTCTSCLGGSDCYVLMLTLVFNPENKNHINSLLLVSIFDITPQINYFCTQHNNTTCIWIDLKLNIKKYSLLKCQFVAQLHTLARLA